MARPRTLLDRACEVCFHTFRPDKHTRRFCSRACRDVAHRGTKIVSRAHPRKLPNIRTCASCFHAFKPSTSTRRFCSLRCMYLAQRNEPEIVSRARELWKQGYSAGVIARHITAEFEETCTKNRIIGIMHRYPEFDPHPEPTGMKRLSWYYAA